MEMEVVSGIGEEARPKPCSTEIELAEKTLNSDSNGQENGVRVSENGDEKAKVETEKLNESGVIEDCVMNGVSSLLKLKQDKEIVEAEAEDGEDEDEDEEDDDDDDEDDDEEHKYCVGDFVWGKIKNHPWWPGQIYDPSDASDLALKIKQKGKFLVAYFGDGTFAWCGVSQLKPFAESFKECSKVSNSRSFIVAVEEAVEEIGRHIERVLVCDCAEEKHKFKSREVNNAGIKEGVLVRDVRREMISALLSGKHGEILKDVKCFAETVSFNSLLELEVLKRKVSAFYRCKRGYGLTEYHEPQSVPGLEDKNNSDDDDDDEGVGNDGFKWRAKRSSVEEEEVAVDPEESVQRSIEKCSGFPDHRLQHRRKQKSIAEILENESAAKVRFETEPANGNVKSGKKKLKGLDEVKDELVNVTTATPRRRKMSEVMTIEDAGLKQVGESSKGKAVSRKKKKKDVDDDGSGDREETAKNEISDPEIDIDSTPLASLRKRVRVDASSVERSVGNGEIATQTSKRERKKSKYLSPEYLSDFSRRGRKKSKVESESSKVSSENKVGEQMTDASDSLVVAVEENRLDKPCQQSLDNGLGHQELSEELSNAVEFLRLGATPTELRDLIRIAALGTQYPKDSSSRDMAREFMTIYRSFTYHDGANNKFLGSYESSDKEKEELNETGKPEIKGKERKERKLKAKQQSEEEVKEIGKEENETDKHGTTKKERKPKKSKSKKQGEQEEEARKESSEPIKKERKRRKPESKKQADEEEETCKVSSESKKKEKKSKKPKHEEEETRNETEKPEKKKKKKKKKREGKRKHEEEETRDETEKSEKKEKEKKKKKKREGKSKKQKVEEKKKETEKEFSGAELFVTFGSGSSLPKKEDLIEIYEKFGALDKERTDMLDTNFSGRVVFLAVADGEKAFESSQEKCPFASNSTVKFRLKYPNERTEEKKAEAEFAESTMEMEYVKKKLEDMRMLLDDCDGGMTEEVKVKLEGETVDLLEKLRKMRSC